MPWFCHHMKLWLFDFFYFQVRIFWKIVWKLAKILAMELVQLLVWKCTKNEIVFHCGNSSTEALMYAFGLHLLGLRKRRKIMELTLYTLGLFFKSPISVISFGKKYSCIKAITEEKTKYWRWVQPWQKIYILLQPKHYGNGVSLWEQNLS